jgi:hypothetical protein
VNRRDFLLTGGATAASTGLLASPLSPGAGNQGNLLNAEACAQWLAWELWNRSAATVNAEEIPLGIRRSLAALPPPGALILKDSRDNYSFAHPSLVDFFVAQRIFGELARGDSTLLTATQTSHDTDQVIRRFVQQDGTCVPILAQWMRDGSTPVLRVNSAGILAKLGQPDVTDQVIDVLREDPDTRNLYLTAVASRVLSLPWEQAGSFAHGSREITSQTAMPPGQAMEFAIRLSQEVKNSKDGAARWCSVVLLSRIPQPVQALVTSALQEALRGEECKENLRAIASALSGADPLQTWLD